MFIYLFIYFSSRRNWDRETPNSDEGTYGTLWYSIYMYFVLHLFAGKHEVGVSKGMRRGSVGDEAVVNDLLSFLPRIQLNPDPRNWFLEKETNKTV
jgi:hypothetical protein